MVGRTISHYKVTAKLGEGGMGVVYKAEDTKLDRPVALKFLAPHLLRDDEGRKRFEREAKAAAKLDHPNICTVHEIDQVDGRTFIAMAFLEGRPLSERIQEGPLKLTEVLSIAIQIAEGLEAAHAKGITHRDIKPDNVMLLEGSRGLIKLMDFGLAQLADSSKLTREGITLGTVHYMSPEQAAGEATGPATDIWALGVVLYEMIAGQRPFRGELDQAIVFSIMNEPAQPLTAVRTGVPKELERIVDKCLAKEPEQRYHHIDELLSDLQAVRRELEPPSARVATATAPVRRLSPVLLGGGVAALLLVLALAAGWYVVRPRRQSSGPPLSTRPLTAYPGWEWSPTFSPDGTQVAFSWYRNDQPTGLFVKVVDSSADALSLSPRGAFPRWSPDGRNIAFVRYERENDRSNFMLVSPLGGAERKLANLARPRTAWTPDSAYLVASVRREGGEIALAMVSAATGEVTPIQYATDPPMEDVCPAVSPDGRRIAFMRYARSANSALFVMPVEGGIPKRVVTADFLIDGIAWMPDGKELIYGSNRRALYRIGVDAADGSTPQQVTGIGEGGYQPAIAGPGFRGGVRMAFVRGFDDWDLVRVDLSPEGKILESKRVLAESTFPEAGPEVSPDGRRIVFRSLRSGSPEIWVGDSADGGNLLRLTTFNGPFAGSPHWSPDGSTIVFDGRNGANVDIYTVPAGGGAMRRLTTEPSTEARSSFSPDGRWIYFRSDISGKRRYYRMPSAGGPNPAASWQPVSPEGVHEGFPSADGRMFYYVYSESTGIYSVPAEGGAERRLADEGRMNFWTVAGDFIYYFWGKTGLVGPSVWRLEPATGNKVRIGSITDLVWSPSHNLSVSPVGRFLVYGRYERGEGDLVLVDNFR